MAGVLQALSAVPWALIALVALLATVFAFTVLAVRSAKTNMLVRFGKIEIRRGPRDRDSQACEEPPRRELRSVDKLSRASDSPRDPDVDQPQATAQ